MAIDKDRREREKYPDPRRPSGTGYTPWPWHPTLNPDGTWSPVDGPHTPRRKRPPTPSKPFYPWPPTLPVPVEDHEGDPIRIASMRGLQIRKKRRSTRRGSSSNSNKSKSTSGR
jgi:hypothetical protein